MFASILEEQGHYVLVAIIFSKSKFTPSRLAKWLDTYGARFVNSVGATAIEVHGACELTGAVRFMGRPLVVYKKGQGVTSCDVWQCVEVNDVYPRYDCIVNSANAKELEMEPTCKTAILYNGQRVYSYSVPRLRFDLSRDLAIANGLVIVADFMEDYCGTVALWQEDNAMLPVMFFYDDDTPIDIDLHTRQNGSRVCVIEQAAKVNYEEL